jgi:hypothetical protein
MPTLPVHCQNCGHVFDSGFHFENVRDIRLSDVQLQCPKCGRMARMPDGTYNVLGNTIQILTHSRRSANDLRGLADALKRARDNNASPEEIKRTIKERAPELSSVADALPHTRNELYNSITAICSVILALAAMAALYMSRGLTAAEVNELIETALREDKVSAAAPTPKRETIRVQYREPKEEPVPQQPKPKRKRESKLRGGRRRLTNHK